MSTSATKEGDRINMRITRWTFRTAWDLSGKFPFPFNLIAVVLLGSFALSLLPVAMILDLLVYILI